MSMLPIFPMKLILLIIPVGIAAVVLGTAAGKGTNIFRKQPVAWAITALMIVLAVFIGIGKSPLNNPRPESVPAPTVPPANTPPVYMAASYVWDNARVLSDRTVRELDARNDELWDRCQATIGVVTCNYGGDDLYDYAMQCAEDMGLGGYDMIVVLDISGDNYWLLQGNDIRRDFTDDDCSDYAYDYLESDFARGDYEAGLLNLVSGLHVWYYGTYYN